MASPIQRAQDFLLRPKRARAVIAAAVAVADADSGKAGP